MEFQEINKTTKKTATRDLQELVRSGILIKSGRTGRGVYYSLNLTYKGDIRGHETMSIMNSLKSRQISPKRWDTYQMRNEIRKGQR